MAQEQTVQAENEQSKAELTAEMKSAIQERIVKQIASELQIAVSRVKTTVGLLDEGNTIPFIARYRKEMTGELDENQLRDIEERLTYLRNLEDRKLEVVRLIDEQGKLTDELRTAIEQSVKLQEVEDLYRPYRQKRKTRASVAKEKGLEPLAEWILAQPKQGELLSEAAGYISEEKGVQTAEEAVQGAMDIIAEQIADDAKIRLGYAATRLSRVCFVRKRKTLSRSPSMRCTTAIRSRFANCRLTVFWR